LWIQNLMNIVIKCINQLAYKVILISSKIKFEFYLYNCVKYSERLLYLMAIIQKLNFWASSTCIFSIIAFKLYYMILRIVIAISIYVPNSTYYQVTSSCGCWVFPKQTSFWNFLVQTWIYWKDLSPTNFLKDRSSRSLWVLGFMCKFRLCLV